MAVMRDILAHVEVERCGDYYSMPDDHGAYVTTGVNGVVDTVRFVGRARGYRKHTEVGVSVDQLIVHGCEGARTHASPRTRYNFMAQIPGFRDVISFSKGHTKYTSPTGKAIYFNKSLVLSYDGEGVGDVAETDASLNGAVVGKTVRTYCENAVIEYITNSAPPIMEWALWWVDAKEDAQQLWTEMRECQFGACWFHSTVYMKTLKLDESTQYQLELLSAQPPHQRALWLTTRPNVSVLLKSSLEADFKRRIKTGGLKLEAAT